MKLCMAEVGNKPQPWSTGLQVRGGQRWAAHKGGAGGGGVGQRIKAVDDDVGNAVEDGQRRTLLVPACVSKITALQEAVHCQSNGYARILCTGRLAHMSRRERSNAGTVQAPGHVRVRSMRKGAPLRGSCGLRAHIGRVTGDEEAHGGLAAVGVPDSAQHILRHLAGRYVPQGVRCREVADGPAAQAPLLLRWLWLRLEACMMRIMRACSVRRPLTIVACYSFHAQIAGRQLRCHRQTIEP